jgi:ubiquinone/menaquinone biosynthesis C-methylase UbiE
MDKIADFKQRVEQEWAADDTAAAWQKYYPQMQEQMVRVTQAMVDAAAPEPGMSVLDLASGTGEPALSLARRVAPTGKVMATDLSRGMLAALSANAAAQGLTNVDTQVCDAQALPFPAAHFDLVTSRFGVMFFVEIDRALAEIRRVTRLGHRVAFMVWGAPAPGTLFGATAVPFIRRLAVTPDPDAPGPMRFAEPGKLARLMEAAGFQHVQEKSAMLPAPFRASPQDFLSSMMEIAAPFRNAAATLSPEERRAAEAEASGNLARVYDGTFINVTAPVLIITGTSS